MLYWTTKSSTRSSQKTANCVFRLRDLANPLVSTVMDDFLPFIEDEIKSLSEIFEEQQWKQEENNRKNENTIILDDNNVLNVSDLLFTCSNAWYFY